MDKTDFKNGKIYKIICPDDYFYYGSTSTSMKKRKSWHKNRCKNGYGQDKLYNHLNLWDWEDITFSVIEEYSCSSRKELTSREDEYLKENILNPKCLNSYRSSLMTKEERSLINKTKREERRKQICDQREKNKKQKRGAILKVMTNKNTILENNIECEFCGNKFSTRSNLISHQKRTKYCLKIQGKNNKTIFECKYCNKILASEKRLKTHYDVCSKYNENKLEEKLQFIIKEKDSIISQKDSIIKELKDQIKDLQDKLENIAIRAVERPNFEDETVININDENDFLSDSDFIIEESDIEDEYKQIPSLEVKKGYTIEHREEDGYINVTNLCKAGGKLFKNWKKTQKTKAFLQVLSNEVLIGTSLLIKYNTGYGSEQGTWVHPQVAINIAQWISPSFDVKVSG